MNEQEVTYTQALHYGILSWVLLRINVTCENTSVYFKALSGIRVQVRNSWQSLWQVSMTQYTGRHDTKHCLF